MLTCCTGGLWSFRGTARGWHCPCSKLRPRELPYPGLQQGVARVLLEVCQFFSCAQQGLGLAAPHPNMAAYDVLGAWWQHGLRVTCIMQSSPMLAALSWGQKKQRIAAQGLSVEPEETHRETLCSNSATVLRHGLGCPCLQLFLGGNKIKSLVRGCWLGAPLGVLVSLHSLEETHEHRAWCPGLVCAWGCLQ